MIRMAVASICALMATFLASSAWNQPTPDQKQGVLTREYTAALSLLTAVSASDLASIAGGRVVLLGTLSEKSRSQVLAAELAVAGPQTYDSWLGSAVDQPDVALGLWIPPAFCVEITSSTLGDSRARIPLGEATGTLSTLGAFFVGAGPGDWRPSDTDIVNLDLWVALATDDTYARKSPPTRKTAPPSAEVSPAPEIIQKSPADSAERLDWLRREVRRILSPIGRTRLALAGGVPFQYDDFDEARVLTIASLSSAQCAWVEELYSRHRTKYAPSLPEWKALENVLVKLSVAYQPTVSVLQRVADDGTARRMLSRAKSSDARLTDERQQFPPGDIPVVYQSMPGKGLGWRVQ